MAKDTRRFVGFRLHPKHDADIIQDEAKYADRTQRWKEVYRKALMLESGSFRMESSFSVSVEEPLPSEELPHTPVQLAEEPAPKSLEPLVWKFPPDEPKEKRSNTDGKPATATKASVLANIKQGF